MWEGQGSDEQVKRMRFGRVHLFKVFGIPIRLDYTWFLILALFTWVLASTYYPSMFPEWKPAIHWILGFLSALLLFASVLLHELGHSWVAIRSGIPITSITLFIFGGMARMSRQPPNAQVELRMAIAGPLTSLALGVLSLTLAQLFPAAPAAIFSLLGRTNVALALFNLLPGFPLDGGRVLRALLWKKKGDLVWATRISSRAGKIIAVTIIGMGFVSVMRGNIGGIWLAIIGLFLLQAAETAYQQVLFRASLSGIKVRQIMRPDVVVVPPELTINRLVDDYFLKYHYTCFPVVHEGKLVGAITLRNVRHLSRGEWSTTPVKDAMTLLEEIATLEPAEDAVKVLQRMVKDGIGRFPVVERGRVVGILTRRDIVELLKIKTDLGR